MYRIPLRFVALGALVWLIFLIFIRLLGADIMYLGNPVLMLLFIASTPLLIATIFVLSRLTATPVRDMPIPVTIMTFTALMLDGLAIAFTNLYGDSPDQIAASAAYLLFGGGLGILCSFLLAQRAEKRA